MADDAAIATPSQQGPDFPNPTSIVVPLCHQQAPPSLAFATEGRDRQHHTAHDAAVNDTEPVGTDAVVPGEGDAAAVPPAGMQELVDVGQMAGGVGAEAAAVPAGPGIGVVDEELLEDAAKAADDIAIVVRRVVRGWVAGALLGIIDVPACGIDPRECWCCISG